MISIKSTNPLRKGLPREYAVDPCIITILGATGDLTHRKLMPALYRLYLGGILPRRFAIVGYASAVMTSEQYREWVKDHLRKSSESLPLRDDLWEGFAQSITFISRTDNISESLTRLKDHLDEIDHRIDTGGNYLFYLSLPPAFFAEYTENLKHVGLMDEGPNNWRRIIVEKPFGMDLASAQELNAKMLGVIGEDQIYRIDHYLGKETVQNILVFRFANSFIEPLLNSKYVDSIQVCVAETVGVEDRGGYYDPSGALRDMVQNHILQIVSLICMDQPAAFDAKHVREEKSRLLRSIRRMAQQDVSFNTVRGQYGPGVFLGTDIPGYREEKGVDPNSTTETYAAIKLSIDNERWRGTPIYVRTGKRLAKRVSEVAIQLKQAPIELFGEAAAREIEPNIIEMNIQPDEGISVRFHAKVPGLEDRMRPVRMDFRYGASFGPSSPEAYERLLMDALLGDASLYSRADAVEAAWEICDPILNVWKANDTSLHTYSPGTWGPEAADRLLINDGRKWHRL